MTLKNPNLPDAGWDPIASEEVPFSGDFWMAGNYAVHANYIRPATGTSVTVWSNKFNVSGDAKFAKTMTVVGATNLNNTLTVTGQTHLLDNLIVDKDANIAQNLGVTGNALVGTYIGLSGYEYISGEDDDNYGLKVDNKIYAGGIDITGDLVIDGNCYITQEITASTGKFEEVSAQSATADVLYVTQLLSAVSATFHNIDITASEASGFVITGQRPIPPGYYEIPNTLPVSAHSNLWLDKAGLMVDGWTILSGDVKMERKLGVSGDVTLSGNTYVNTLNATGAVDFDSTLNVDGATTLNTLAVTSNATVGGTLGVTGATTLNTLHATGAVDFDSTLNVDGATTLNTLAVTSNATVGGTLGVTGATTLNTLHATGAVDFDSALNVDGATTLNTLNAAGAVDFDSTLNVDGATTLRNTLNVTGKTTLSDELHVVKSITTEKNLYVTGNAKVGAFGSFGTYVSAAGSDNNGYGLIIDKNGNIKGNTYIGGTLGVTGAVDFDSTLNVDGATTLNGGATVKTSLIVEKANKSMSFDGEKIYRKNGTQSAVTFLFPSSGGTLVTRPNSPPTSGNIPMFNEYGNIVDSGNKTGNFLHYATSPVGTTISLIESKSVYRYTDLGYEGTMILPNIGSEIIPSSDDYFCFEIELTIPSDITDLVDTAWASFTWLPGFELPQYDYAGKTLYISCRLDCQTRKVTASCWRVA